MKGSCTKETLEYQYDVRCSKFHIINTGKGISIETDYTDGVNTIPNCRFASVACEEDLVLLHQELGSYLRRKQEEKISLKNKIIQYDFSHTKK